MATVEIALIAAFVIVVVLSSAVVFLRRIDRSQAGRPDDVASSLKLDPQPGPGGALQVQERVADDVPGDTSALDDHVDIQDLVESAFEEPDVLDLAVPQEEEPEPEADRTPELKDRLGKSRGLFSGYLGSIFSRNAITQETFDDLEEALIRADVGVGVSQVILDNLRQELKAKKIKDPQTLSSALVEQMLEIFEGADRGLKFQESAPNLWLFVGVNGVGKTTTIGKIAIREVGEGKRVLLAAGDTFRAAAGEQLEMWANRASAQIVRGQEGGDPGAVVFDAIDKAVSKNLDLILADTAGRLHTKVNLMEELKKIRRIAEKSNALVTEVLLVIDATTGQNGLTQAKEFAQAVGVTGIVLTKLDGTAKGGIALAIERELKIPIKLVGVGEGPGDLISFQPKDFIEAIVSLD